jgi:aspartyl-tRNA(Asn)/glutamyl-tRNA(Gln) amidotransferase subunit A
MTDELYFMSAVELARRIATREVSPVAVVDAVLARAAVVDPALNLFAMPLFDAARDAARTAEKAITAGESLGPLHGVPITIKDNVAIGGLRLANGSAAFLDFVAPADAAVVARIKAAGAIIIGKTNLPEFAHKVLTDSPAFGFTRSPWNLERTPGGSSGGASAALAAGVAPLAVGTDGGGSIRCPASCCGLVGLKATLGRIPFEAPDGFGNYSFVGPMARRVQDVSVLFSVMAGMLAADPFSLGAPALPKSILGAPEGTTAGLRIGWIEHFGRYRTEPEVAALTSAAVRAFERQGAHVEELHDPCFDDVFDTYTVIASSAHAARFGGLVERWHERMTPSILDSIAKGTRWSAVDLVHAHDRRTALFRAVQRLFERFDVIATPTMTAPPKPLDAGGSIATEMYAEWAAPLYPFNLTGHPALSVPAGFTASGLPVGLQLIGPWFAEAQLLGVAARLERINPWHERRPSMCAGSPSAG